MLHDLGQSLWLDNITRDLFQAVNDRTNGLDGRVSLEVSPLLAYDTASTLAQAKELFMFAKAGVDVDVLATQLQDEGAKSFTKSWNELMGIIASKSEALKMAA